MTPESEVGIIFTSEQVDEICASVVAAAQQICGDRLREVILYGSYARGDFRDCSDVDIMVLVDASDGECEGMRQQLAIVHNPQSGGLTPSDWGLCRPYAGG